MKIEAVTVCHNYSDFLAEALPINLPYIDRLVVVTHPGDAKTIALCDRYGLDCVKTEAMHEEGDHFNKGRCINLGLGHLRGLDWFLHLDADVVLPHRFRDLLHRSRLKTENLYGADRVNVFGYESWEEIKKDLHPHYSDRYFVEPGHIGARIIHEEHGYTPIGYFQLWHKSQGKRYPIHQGNAEHTDVLFAAQWRRDQRVLLPEVVVFHLDSNDGPVAMGQNWNGRKSPEFKRRPHPHHPPRCPYRPCRCPHHD